MNGKTLKLLLKYIRNIFITFAKGVGIWMDRWINRYNEEKESKKWHTDQDGVFSDQEDQRGMSEAQRRLQTHFTDNDLFLQWIIKT